MLNLPLPRLRRTLTPALPSQPSQPSPPIPSIPPIGSFLVFTRLLVECPTCHLVRERPDIYNLSRGILPVQLVSPGGDTSALSIEQLSAGSPLSNLPVRTVSYTIRGMCHTCIAELLHTAGADHA